MIRDIIRAETHCPVPKATQTWGNNYVHKTRGAFAMQVRKALNDESGLMPIEIWTSGNLATSWSNAKSGVLGSCPPT